MLSWQVFNSWKPRQGKQIRCQYEVKAFCKSWDIMESIINLINLPTTWEQKEQLQKYTEVGI